MITLTALAQVTISSTSESSGVIDQMNQEAFMHLTEPLHYNKYLPPQQQHPIMVNLSIHMFDFGTIDELSTEFSIHLFIKMSWYDERLIINTNQTMLEGGSWHLDRLWTPTLHIPNSKTTNDLQNLSQNKVIIRIRSNGQILMSRRITLNGEANQLDFRFFPFEVQKIHFEIESSQLTIDNMQLKWVDSVPFDYNSKFLWNGYNMVQHELYEHQTTYNRTGTFSKVGVILHLKSHFQQFLLDYFMPIYLCAIISWTSFWIYIPEAGPRISLGVTILFTLVTSDSNVRAKMPSIHVISALNVWTLGCIVFVFAVLVQYCLVNYLFYSEKRSQLKRNKGKKSAKAKQLGINTQHHVLQENNNINTNFLEKFRLLSLLFSIVSFHRSTVTSNSNSDTYADNKCNSEENFERNSNKITYISIVACCCLTKTIKTDTISHSSSSSRSSSSSSHMDNIQQKNKGEEIAFEIDRISRIAFPVTFAFFNLIYWTVVLVSSARFKY